jgi:hypothetical protein
MEQSQGTGAVGGALSGAAAGAAFGPVGAVVGGVIGGISGFLGGGGEKKAKKLAKAQAKEIIRTAEENARVARIQAAQQVGLTKAATYASNIQDTGTTKKYRDTMEAEYRRNIAWDLDAAQRNAELARKGGQIAAQSISRAGWGQVLSGATAFGGAVAGGAFTKADPVLSMPDITVTAKRR